VVKKIANLLMALKLIVDQRFGLINLLLVVDNEILQDLFVVVVGLELLLKVCKLLLEISF
jgi:hypothetical protein